MDIQGLGWPDDSLPGVQFQTEGEVISGEVAVTIDPEAKEWTDIVATRACLESSPGAGCDILGYQTLTETQNPSSRRSIDDKEATKMYNFVFPSLNLTDTDTVMLTIAATNKYGETTSVSSKKLLIDREPPIPAPLSVGAHFYRTVLADQVFLESLRRQWQALTLVSMYFL
jgi:hypothetical protein